MRRSDIMIGMGLMAALALAGSCKNDDTDFGDAIPDAGFKPVEVVFSEEPLAEAEEDIDTDDNDYVENSSFRHTVAVVYTEDGAEVTGAEGVVDVVCEGGHVTVHSDSKSVAYQLSGSCSDGSFKVYSNNKFKLVLDGLKLHNPKGAAVNNQCGKSMYVVLPEGKNNMISCGSQVTIPEGEDMKGAFFSEGQILISGKGKLHVASEYRNGLATDDYLVIRPGSVIIVTSTAGNAVKANDGVSVRGSVLNLYTTYPGGKGINCETAVTFCGGRTTVITEGGCLVEANDTTSSAAIKSDSTVCVTGGELNLLSRGDGGKGINADRGIRIAGGQVTAITMGHARLASPNALKSGGDIEIAGGSVYAYSSHAQAVKTSGEAGVSWAPDYVSLDKRGEWFFSINYSTFACANRLCIRSGGTPCKGNNP